MYHSTSPKLVNGKGVAVLSNQPDAAQYDEKNVHHPQSGRLAREGMHRYRHGRRFYLLKQVGLSMSMEWNAECYVQSTHNN